MVDGIIKQYEIYRVWALIDDCLKENLTDPLTGKEARTSASHWVFDEFPNQADLGKPAPQGWKFPIIEIDYPIRDDELKSLDGTKFMINDTMDIMCHSRTKSEANQLADQVIHILQTTVKSTLNQACLYCPDVVGTSNGTDFLFGNKMFTKTITLSFRRFD